MSTHEDDFSLVFTGWRHKQWSRATLCGMVACDTMELMQISVHDNFLLSYFVDAEKAEIHLHTACLDGVADEHTDVIFAGVAAYHFECDNFGTILFDIYEAKVDDIYDDNKGLFERLKNYVWPNSEFKSRDELLSWAQEQGFKGFIIHSSFGLSGWVGAKSMAKCPK